MHWAVAAEAAARLTTSTFDRLKADPSLSRAEALRQAMPAYLDDATLGQEHLSAAVGGPPA
jgi:hypothetical protein